MENESKSGEPVKIEGGDTVTLKSGGPLMTMQHPVVNGNGVWKCSWFAGNELRDGNFHINALMLSK